jgi:coenzyme F420-reducing hydrogenase beta subunit
VPDPETTSGLLSCSKEGTLKELCLIDPHLACLKVNPKLKALIVRLIGKIKQSGNLENTLIAQATAESLHLSYNSHV